jgi:hypothetical protein
MSSRQKCRALALGIWVSFAPAISLASSNTCGPSPFATSPRSSKIKPRTRFLLIAAAFLIVLAALGLYANKFSAPRAARLLPESDGIVFVDLAPIRLATHLDTKPVPHSPEYQQFIDATGIVFERDLNSVAFALHKMPDDKGPNGLVAYSEVFIGRFQQDRLTKYLAGIATAREHYADHDIYTIPVGLGTARLLRVTILNDSTIAASNAPTTEQIHAILDRFRSTSSPFSGPTLLTGLYPDVPMFSPVWGIGAIGLPFSEDGRVSVQGLRLPLPDTTPLIASLRYTNGLHLRIEQIAANEPEAIRSVQKLNNLLLLFHKMQEFQGGDPDADMINQLVSSIQIEQSKDRAILTAKVPLEAVRKITSAAK